MKVRAWTLLALALPLVPSMETPAQEPASGGFGEVMTVTEVQVPVQVFADGEPVAGLSEGDFEIYDNGVRRELSAFEVVDLTGGEGAAPAAAEVAPSTGAHRTLLMMFDLAFNHPTKLARAARGVRRMLEEQLHPRDRVAVATFDLGRGVTLISGFTTDRSESLTALSNLERMIAGGTIEVGPLGAVLARARTPRPAESAASMVQLSRQLGGAAALALGGRAPAFRPPARSLARAGEAEGLAGSDEESGPGGNRGQQQQNDFGAAERAEKENPRSQVAADSPAALGDSLAVSAEELSATAATAAATVALGEITTLFRDLPGDKHMFYLSRGLPNLVASSQRVATLMEGMFRAFKASGWKLQALDISGVPDPFGGSSFEGSAGDGPATVGFVSDALVNAAKGTGGEVYENFNDLSRATQKVIQRTRLTYLLTFAVANPPDDGRYHRLEVRLKGGHRGRSVVHREGYYNPRPVAERSSLERRLDEAEGILGDAVGGELEAAAVVTTLASGPGGGRVGVWLEAPGAQFLGQRAQGLWSARVEAYLLDGDERFVDSRAGQVELDLAAVGPRLEGGALRVFVPLSAPAGEHRLRLRLVEEESGKSWLGSAKVRVPADAKAPHLLPPIFPDLSSSGVVTRLAAEGKAAGEASPLHFAGRELVPRAATTCRPGERVPVVVLAAGEALPGRELGSRVLDAKERAVAANRLEWLSREERGADGLERTLGTLSCADLSPGHYWLEITLRGAGEQKPSASSRAPFEVKEP